MNNKKHVKTAFVTLISIIVTLYMLIHLWVISGKMSFSEIAHWFFGNSDNSNGELMKIILNLIGGLAVMVGLYLSYKRLKSTEDQISLSRQSQIDERFKNAIEHISSTNRSIIIGGIAELHQIVVAANKQYSAVVAKVYCDYISQSSNIYKHSISEIDFDLIQIIFDYLFPKKDDEFKPYNLIRKDLSYCNLHKIEMNHTEIVNVDLTYSIMPNLNSVSFTNVVFNNTRFPYCNFFNCEISGGSFKEVYFDHCNFRKFRISNVTMDHINLFDCLLEQFQLYNSTLRAAEIYACFLDRSSFHNTNINGCNFIGLNFKDTTFQSNDKVFYGTVIFCSDLQNVTIIGKLEGLNIYSCRDAIFINPIDNCERFLNNHCSESNNLSGVTPDIINHSGVNIHIATSDLISTYMKAFKNKQESFFIGKKD